ncbi:uncharacterized protein [Pyxicephalus adspersus]|uniref:uncharacterized protein n=1 Tax=Pyxicephalus adspersus TaxID=30357 RepID=UPI003B598060
MEKLQRRLRHKFHVERSKDQLRKRWSDLKNRERDVLHTLRRRIDRKRRRAREVEEQPQERPEEPVETEECILGTPDQAGRLEEPVEVEGRILVYGYKKKMYNCLNMTNRLFLDLVQICIWFCFYAELILVSPTEEVLESVVEIEPRMYPNYREYQRESEKVHSQARQGRWQKVCCFPKKGDSGETGGHGLQIQGSGQNSA